MVVVKTTLQTTTPRCRLYIYRYIELKERNLHYNQSLVSLATHSQSRLNSFQTVKTLFLHCFTCTSRLHLFSRLCPIFSNIFSISNYFFFLFLVLAIISICLIFSISKADETLVIVETLIYPLKFALFSPAYITERRLLRNLILNSAFVRF